MACIADCLGLINRKTDNPPEQCRFGSASGLVAGNECPEIFSAMRNKEKVVICDFEMSWYSEVPALPTIASFKSCDVMNFKSFLTYNETKKNIVARKNSAEFLKSLQEILKSNGVKTVFQIGSWDEIMMNPFLIAATAASPSKREIFVQMVLNVTQSYNFDGILLYWVFPGCPKRSCSGKPDHENVVPFLNELGKILQDAGKLNIIFTLTNDININRFMGDYFTKVSRFVDYFIMEAYGQSSIYDKRIGLEFDLTVTENLLREFIKSVDSMSVVKKLVIGFTPKSLNFKLVNSKGRLGSFHNFHAAHNLKFNQICKLMQDENYTHVRNDWTQHYASSDKFLFVYDDYNSLKNKVQKLILDNDMAGAHVVSFNYDDVYGECGCGHAPYTRMLAQLLKGDDCKLRKCF